MKEAEFREKCRKVGISEENIDELVALALARQSMRKLMEGGKPQ